MKNMIRRIGYILVSVLLLTGCGGYALENEDTTVDTWAETVEKWKEMSPQEIGDHVTVEVSDTYHIDADIMLSDELDSYEVARVKLTRHLYEDPASVLEELLNYLGIEYEGEIEVREKDDLLENGNMMQSAGVKYGGGEYWVQVRTAYATMTSPFTENYGTWNMQNVYDRQALGRVHHDFMAEPSEKELITEAEILEIKEKLESIFGVEFMEEYTLYTCTAERLQQVVEWELEFMKALGMEIAPEEYWQVSEADEGTVLSFYQGYKGIPLLADSPNHSVTGAVWGVQNYCQVISSKEKVEEVSLQNPFEIKEEVETVKILSFGELMEKHAAGRGALETTVVNVGLYYTPIYTGEGLDFVTKPVWYIQIETPLEGSAYVQRDSILYDAVTGEEIPW